MFKNSRALLTKKWIGQNEKIRLRGSLFGVRPMVFGQSWSKDGIRRG
jgi:hypothetical protein